MGERALAAMLVFAVVLPRTTGRFRKTWQIVSLCVVPRAGVEVRDRHSTVSVDCVYCLVCDLEYGHEAVRKAIGIRMLLISDGSRAQDIRKYRVGKSLGGGLAGHGGI